MQKKRKKQLDVAARVDFRRARKFACGVVRILESSRSFPANLPWVAPGWRAYAQALGISACTGCQPAPPLTPPAAAHFEIPVAGQAAEGTEMVAAPATALLPRAPAPSLPEKLPAAFARQQSCEHGKCVLARWLPDPSYAESPFEEVSAQAAIWVHTLGRGAQLTVPPNAALELVVVCLSGELEARDVNTSDANPPPAVRLSPWTALRAAGAGTELECEAGGCRAMLALIAPNSTLASAVHGAPAAPPRSFPLDVRTFQDATVAASNQGKNHVRVLFGGGATSPPPPFSLSLLQNDGPVDIASHSHDTSWESLLVLEGHGDLELRGRSYPIAGGESLHIAPRVRHGYVARGPEPFVALQLYTPGGPEQRFLAPVEPAPASGSNSRPPTEPP